MTRLVAVLDTLRARIAVLLIAGMAIAALLVLAVAGHSQSQDYARERIAVFDDLVSALEAVSSNDPVHRATIPEVADADRRIRNVAGCEVYRASRSTMATQDRSGSAGCVRIHLRGYPGPVDVLVLQAPEQLPSLFRLTSDLILIIVLFGIAMMPLTTRIANRPLKRLLAAALSVPARRNPTQLRETGPREVREALAAFNAMERRIADGMRERTQMLAAINHDLRTPMTRMRLRIENVADERLREQLVADLAAMQLLADDGLALARSLDAVEDWAEVDLVSLLESLAEDAVEVGSDVRMAPLTPRTIRTKPNALNRCLNNLIDNAVRYAGAAELGYVLADEQLVITVRDHGNGIPDADLQRMFEPFVRGRVVDHPTGSGLGLTIARLQADQFGGTVQLVNEPSGGLTALVTVGT